MLDRRPILQGILGTQSNSFQAFAPNTVVKQTASKVIGSGKSITQNKPWKSPKQSNDENAGELGFQKKRAAVTQLEPASIRIPRRLLYSDADIDGDVNILCRRWLFWEKSNMDSAYFTVMSWNILAPKFASSNFNQNANPKMTELDWNTRKYAIMDQIMYYGPDFVCLQEVDPNDYVQFFKPILEKQGYGSVFVAKSDFDGLATFFRSDRFSLESSSTLRYNETTLAESDSEPLPPSLLKAQAIRLAPFPNVASVVIVKNKATKRFVRLVNTHLLWQEDFRDVKLLQSAILMDYLKSEQFDGVSGKNMATVFCADLNSTPRSPVLQYLLTAKIAAKHFGEHDFGKFSSKKYLRHKLSFSSAYDGSELPFTHFAPHFQDTIDYILHTPNLKLISRLDNSESDYYNHIPYFPTMLNPSDHIPLLAVFKQVK
ncbi:Endonuclease/exonuclease/phosphatase [Paraphysoderma sedebokerense]|nr:Endonuclease/exonuclease/phosphatase [Paraphysoderma sedebokerense]